MSHHSRKPRAAAASEPVQEYYIDSLQENQQLGKPNPEFEQIERICEKQALSLQLKNQQEVLHKKEKSQEERKISQKKEGKNKKQTSKELKNEQQNDEPFYDDDVFLPDSEQLDSDQEEQEQGYQPENIDSNLLKDLHTQIKLHQLEFANPDKQQQKIKQLVEQLEISFEKVEKCVNQHLRKKKVVRSSGSDKGQHQTIYRKTQMFDDAINFVLKSTPYACINDLRQQIKSKLSLDLAKQTLIRRLKNLCYRYQKFAIAKPQSRSQKILELRRRYIKLYRQIQKKINPIFFYGTSHIALDQYRGSMWMKSKDNGEIDHLLQQRNVVCMTVIMSSHGIQFYRVFDGFYHTERFRQSIKEWVQGFTAADRPNSHRGKPSYLPAYLAMEASPIHCPKNTFPPQLSQSLLSSKILPIAFPSQSSSLNPAQIVFERIKYQCRSKIKTITLTALKQCIHHVMESQLDFEDVKFSFASVQNSMKEYQ